MGEESATNSEDKSINYSSLSHYTCEEDPTNNDNGYTKGITKNKQELELYIDKQNTWKTNKDHGNKEDTLTESPKGKQHQTISRNNIPSEEEPTFKKQHRKSGSARVSKRGSHLSDGQKTTDTNTSRANINCASQKKNKTPINPDINRTN